MKSTLITLISIFVLNFAQGQQSNSSSIEKVTLINAGKMTVSKDKSITKFNENVKIQIPDKLEIEADSVQLDNAKGILTAFGTKSYSFTGKVVVGKLNNGSCKYRLGGDLLELDREDIE